MSLKTFVTAFLILIANAAITVAQTATGTISGVVKDDSGAAIPGASLHIVNQDTAAAVDVFSNDQGIYAYATDATGGDADGPRRAESAILLRGQLSF